jgi:hypothetical protein
MKQGRVTVPPALALACDGYSGPRADGMIYSRADPPPHWNHVREMLGRGGAPALKNFLRGGWRDVPETDRWWEHALAGLEKKRMENMALVGGLQNGMEGAQSIEQDLILKSKL